MIAYKQTFCIAEVNFFIRTSFVEIIKIYKMAITTSFGFPMDKNLFLNILRVLNAFIID